MARRPSLGFVLRVSAVALLFTTAAMAAVAPASVRAAPVASTLAGPFKFTVGDVVAGSPFTVSLTDAPCEDVTVTFFIDSVAVATQQVRVGGAVKFTPPYNSSGQLWTIIVQCPGGTTGSDAGNIG